MSDFPEGLATYITPSEPASKPLFEVGKRYDFRRMIGGEETQMAGRVESYDHPMLKTADENFDADSKFFPGGIVRGEIINVTSPTFISATLSQHQD